MLTDQCLEVGIVLFNLRKQFLSDSPIADYQVSDRCLVVSPAMLGKVLPDGFFGRDFVEQFFVKQLTFEMQLQMLDRPVAIIQPVVGVDGSFKFLVSPEIVSGRLQLFIRNSQPAF